MTRSSGDREKGKREKRYGDTEFTESTIKRFSKCSVCSVSLW